MTALVIKEVKEKLPDTKIYIWTGYLYEELQQKASLYPKLQYILDHADFLIDGPYIQELRDITLHMMGSSNQRIWDLKQNKVVEFDKK